MRIRIAQLLEARGMNPHAFSKADPRLSHSFCYRLVQRDGLFSCLKPAQLDALCDIFGVGPNDLFERTPEKKSKRR